MHLSRPIIITLLVLSPIFAFSAGDQEESIFDYSVSYLDKFHVSYDQILKHLLGDKNAKLLRSKFPVSRFSTVNEGNFPPIRELNQEERNQVARDLRGMAVYATEYLGIDAADRIKSAARQIENYN